MGKHTLLILSILLCMSDFVFTQTNATVKKINYEDKGLWTDSKKIKLEQIFQIGRSSNALLANPFDITTDKTNNIYIADLTDNCIKIYSRNGTFIRTIGSQGQGPGEFYEPKKICIVNEQYLYVLSKQKISRFTLSGEYLDAWRNDLGFLIKSFIVLPGNKSLVISKDTFFPSSKNNNYNFFVLDKKGHISGKYGDPALLGTTTLGKSYAACQLQISSDNKLICIPEYPYSIYIYNEKLELEKNITMQTNLFDIKPKIKKYNEVVKIYKPRAVVNGYTTFPDGKILISVCDRGDDTWVSGKPDDTYSTYYDLYNKEGIFLQSFSIDETHREVIKHIDKEGFIYTLGFFDDAPMITKYKIAFTSIL